MSDSISFRFNSALVELNRDGTLNRDSLKTAGLQVRAAFADIDGFAGANVERYDMVVNYERAAISREAFEQAIVHAFNDLVRADTELFPLRGDKYPELIPPTRSTAPTYWAAVADFNTDLYVRTTDEDGKKVSDMLGAGLMHLDGARSYGFSQRKISIQYDPRVVEGEVVLAHLRRNVSELIDHPDRSTFFPFITDKKQPTVEYSTRETMYVIS